MHAYGVNNKFCRGDKIFQRGLNISRKSGLGSTFLGGPNISLQARFAGTVGASLPPTLLRLRPLQINSLFPVDRPHLVTVSYKYSIIPYSSIIFRLFLYTDRLSKSHLETGSAHVSAVLSSRHKLHVCVIFAA